MNPKISLRTLAPRLWVRDSNPSTNGTIVLSSMGRSGSTMVADLINHQNDYRVMFEPFRPEKVEAAKPFTFPTYLRPDGQHPLHLEGASRIVSGRVSNRWVNLQNRRVFAKKRLIKDIRTNFFLKWLHTQFAGLKIILLIRHPLYVVNSVLKAWGESGERRRERLLAQPAFTDDMDDTLLEGYANARPGLETQTWYWCFNYHVPLRQFKPGEAHILFYENLLLEPGKQWKELFAFLDAPYSEEGCSRVMDRPSFTTGKKRAEISGPSQFRNGFGGAFAANDIRTCEDIMRRFDLHRLYRPGTAIPDPAASVYRQPGPQTGTRASAAD